MDRFCNIAHEMVAKKKKEMQQCKVVVWGGFTKAEERREAKGKGEKERYTHLNVKEFQRIARRD